MNKQPAQYAVKHKATGLLFAGFDADKQPVWTADESKARQYNEETDARQQALLFTSFGVRAQIKPVTL